MRAILGQYAHELVGLTVLALMTIALIAGQAGATLPATAASHNDSDPPAPSVGIEAAANAAVLHADKIDIDFAAIASLVKADRAGAAPPASIRIRFDIDR